MNIFSNNFNILLVFIRCILTTGCIFETDIRLSGGCVEWSSLRILQLNDFDRFLIFDVSFLFVSLGLMSFDCIIRASIGTFDETPLFDALEEMHFARNSYKIWKCLSNFWNNLIEYTIQLQISQLHFLKRTLKRDVSFIRKQPNESYSLTTDKQPQCEHFSAVDSLSIENANSSLNSRSRSISMTLIREKKTKSKYCRLKKGLIVHDIYVSSRLFQCQFRIFVW